MNKYVIAVAGSRTSARWTNRVLAWEDGCWWQYFVDYTGRTDIEGWFGIGLMKVIEWTLIEERQ